MPLDLTSIIAFVVLILNIIGLFPFSRLNKLEKKVERICYKKVRKRVLVFTETTNIEDFVDKLNKNTDPLASLVQAKNYFYYLIITSIIFIMSAVMYNNMAPENYWPFAAFITGGMFMLYLTIFIVYQTIKIEKFVRKNFASR